MEKRTLLRMGDCIYLRMSDGSEAFQMPLALGFERPRQLSFVPTLQTREPKLHPG